MRKYFEISGYWKDDNTPFENLIVTNYHDLDNRFKDEDIFLYGFSEDMLIELMEEDNLNDFVITKYNLI